MTNFLGERGGGVLMHSSQKLPLNPVFCTHTAVFDQDLAQELPLDQTALDYVSEVARRNDPNLTLEKVRAALGALGLTGSLPCRYEMQVVMCLHLIHRIHPHQAAL